MREFHRAAAAAALLAFAGAAQATASDARFYGLESFTVVYESAGMQTGTKTIHARENGKVRAEISDLQIKMGGMTIPPKKLRTVTNGAEIVTIDLATNTGTRMTNPLYDRMAAGMEGKSGLDVGMDFMKALGGSQTGETRTIAGAACSVWTIPSLMQEHCITDDGITLFTSSNLAGMNMSETAVEYRPGDGGPDEAFSLDGITITDFTMPNLPRRQQ